MKSWKEKSHYIANRASKSDASGHIAEYFIKYIKAMEKQFININNKILEKQKQAKEKYNH